MVTGSTLVPFRSRLGQHYPAAAQADRHHGTSRHAAVSRTAHGANPYVTYQSLYTGRFGARRYPTPAMAARAIGASTFAALSRTPASVDPFVTYAPIFTGRFAGRRYPRMGAVNWRGPWAGPRLGQAESSGFFGSLWNAISNTAENIAGGLPANAPQAGGGWVRQPNPADPTTQLVTGTDTSGNPTTFTVPADWTPAQITANLASTGAGQTSTQSLTQAAAAVDPTGLGGWGVAAIAAAGLGLLFLLKK